MAFTAKIFIKLNIFQWYYMKNFCIEFHTNRSSNIQYSTHINTLRTGDADLRF